MAQPPVSTSIVPRKKLLVTLIIIILVLLCLFVYFWRETSIFGNDSIYKPLSDCPIPPQTVADDSHWSEVVPASSWATMSAGDALQALNAVAVDSKDRVYVAGNFTQIGGLQTVGIARWDPEDNRWTDLDGGLLSSLYDLYINRLEIDAQDRVYVSGRFNMAGDQIVNGIAMWDGQAWHPLGSGFIPPDLPDIALAGDGRLYAAGTFSQLGEQITKRIGYWDGQAWQDPGAMNEKLAALIGAVPEKVAAIAYDPAHKVLYTSGTFDQGDSTQGFLAGWQEASQTWISIAGSYGVMSLRRLKITPWGTLIVAGSTDFAIDSLGALARGGTSGLPPASYGIATYENSKWKGLKSGLTLMGGSKSYLASHGDTQVDPVFVTEMAFDRTGQLYIVGRFIAVDNQCMYGIARWDGTAWYALGSGLAPTNYFGPARSLAFDSKGNLYVAGNFQTAGGKPIRYLARWIP